MTLIELTWMAALVILMLYSGFQMIMACRLYTRNKHLLRRMNHALKLCKCGLWESYEIKVSPERP